METILLTGATGFLGSHLLRELLDRGSLVIAIKRSFSDTYRINQLITDYGQQLKLIDCDTVKLDTIFTTYTINTIIHCATTYDRNDIDVMKIIQSNLFLPLELLNLGSIHGVTNFINTDTVLNDNINNYSLSKKQFLCWLNAYSSKIKCINLSLEHFYGAFDNESKFTTFILRKLSNKAPQIDLTKGEQKRNFVYIDDVVNAFLVLLDNIDSINNSFSSFRVGTEQYITIKDFVLLVKSITQNTNTQLNFGKLPYRINEPMTIKSELKSLNHLNWKAHTSLEEGIKKTLELEGLL